MTKSQNLLGARWLAFAKEAIPLDAPSIQTQEMRRAFYAGASIMFELLTSLPEEMSEEETCNMFSELEQECINFLSRIGKGY